MWSVRFFIWLPFKYNTVSIAKDTELILILFAGIVDSDDDFQTEQSKCYAQKETFRVDSLSEESQTFKTVWIEEIKQCTEDPNCMFFMKTTEKPKCDRSLYPWSKVMTSKNKTSRYKCTEEQCGAEKLVYLCNGNCRRLNKLCCNER